MITEEDFERSIGENPMVILYQSVILFLIFPWIKWGFWALAYVISKTDWVVNKFTKETFENILPWYLEIFTKFKQSMVIFVVCFLVVWVFYSFLESRK